MIARKFLYILALVLLSGCASTFPRPSTDAFKGTATPDGSALFKQTFIAHGGAHLDELQNVSVGLDGKWKQLIRRIQPLVTNFTYRVESQERLLPNDGVYAAHYQGPAGTKSVFRSPDSIQVHYNGEPSNDPAVLSSTALTADAFHLFLLGPLALDKWRADFKRLSDAKLKQQTYYRIYLERIPGFGFSKRDEVVLWIEPETNLTKLIQITLEGHDTTRGAHVEVEYLDYIKREPYVFPSKFFERVNAPIAIDAHAWQLTGIDINRDYTASDLQKPAFKGAARTNVTLNEGLDHSKSAGY